MTGIITANRAVSQYADGTANMQVDPEALPSGAASESFSRAGCTGSRDLDWVPDRESDVVPPEIAATCRACPSRVACLAWARATDSDGYWAGSTAIDRRQLPPDAGGVDAVRQVQLVQARAKAAADRRMRLEQAQALHEPGQGSLRWYRRGGCRCAECRRSNAASRAQERARRRGHAVVAA